jgi:hypothetical protein
MARGRQDVTSFLTPRVAAPPIGRVSGGATTSGTLALPSSSWLAKSPKPSSEATLYDFAKWELMGAQAD